MWMTPYPWCILLGLGAYAAMAWLGEVPRAKHPGQLLLVAGCLFGLSTLLLVGTGYLAYKQTGIPPMHFLSAQSPTWQYRRYVYLFYAFSLSTVICIIHAWVVGILSSRPNRRGS